jgi:hypothetical protein
MYPGEKNGPWDFSESNNLNSLQLTWVQARKAGMAERTL